MLKGIDQRLSAEIVYALMQMGHGDDLVICDINHPAVTIAKETTYGRLLDMAGCDIPTATRAILSLMPLDSFVPAPVKRMQVVGDPEGVVPIFGKMQKVLDASNGAPVLIEALERFAFYEAAKRAFCIIRTADSGPYGCFILKKGVVDLAPL
ncbi:MAG: fucose-binding protein [Rhodobacteraceae bacterium]|jgi:L-fucose mutarotase|uniref:RbsD/FucU family protein n=1 Tax=Roseovarius sp. 10 TaxID=3080563 RepID=UPI001935C1C2|nr:RbsD/FucU domain-containing protein [Roseovarius sp. 10]MBE1288955.1 fucose-binding protein [Paracoccaceae bacterium]MDV7200118.1 RbsD/FucU domain-containing protein [Roseovarius sp. 10]QPI85806.1 fucose-binding protein [Rhodobacterales bacterium HKCCA1288]